MKQIVAFAAIVVVAFGGMVMVRESGRREETPKRPQHRQLQSSGPVATISRGENVPLENHLDRSKWTILEFTADW